MKYAPFAINIRICEMFFLTSTEHTSTMSLVIETQDYDSLHQVQVLLKFGASEMICVARIESQKAMKCAPFAVNV